ncbi:MAG: LysR family transcriptional regulator [Rhodospirillales bacterium]|nr:LysR family transcriptional regulator [Rhodospirillales bacterium]
MSETLRDIRIFIAAYEEQSFTAAATREQATQSGVSQHIHKLEEQFALRLFVREAGRILPTPAADFYYRRCLAVLRAQDEAAQGVQRFATGLEGEIAAGLMPTITRCVFAPAFNAFLAAHPNVRVKLVEGYSPVLTQMVRTGALQFAIVPGFPAVAGLACRPFATTPEVLVRRTGTTEHLAPVRVAELPPLDLVVPSPANTRRRTLESYVLTHGGRLGRTIEIDTMFGTLGLIAESAWAAILPGLMMASAFSTSDFCVNSLVGPPLLLELVTIQSATRELSPAAAALLTSLEKAAEEASRSWTNLLEKVGGQAPVGSTGAAVAPPASVAERAGGWQRSKLAGTPSASTGKMNLDRPQHGST